MAGPTQKRQRTEQQQSASSQQQKQQHQSNTSPPQVRPNDLVWAKLAPELPWWPARLAAPNAAATSGPTVPIEVLGAPERTEILRVQRRRVDCDFRGSLGKHAEPWKRRKCAGIKRAFGEALAHARQLLTGGHARCAQCGTWQPVPYDYVAADWSCPGGCASRKQPSDQQLERVVDVDESATSRTGED